LAVVLGWVFLNLAAAILDRFNFPSTISIAWRLEVCQLLDVEIRLFEEGAALWFGLHQPGLILVSRTTGMTNWRMQRMKSCEDGVTV
jgi:hypothetical protein